MIRSLTFIALCLLCHGAGAQAVYKCSQGGKISYGDRPCAAGTSTRLPPPVAGVTPPEATAVATRDARTLLALEKLRIAREQQQEADERRQDKLARAAQAKRKTCARLRLRHKWAEEDAARVQGKAREAALLKARRQRETMAVECPA